MIRKAGASRGRGALPRPFLRPKGAARLLRGTPYNLRLLASWLRRGELVAVPAETVYGLAGDATDPAACRRIFRAKRRPQSDPLIVHIASLRDLARVAVPNAAALRLARAFWPGPLTLVLPKTALVPALATAGRPSVAVRMPAHPLFRRLIRLCGRPLAAPSANPFGYVSPTSAAHVRDGLGSRIRYILDGGPSRIGLESTIVDLRDPARPAVLRPGAITRAELAQVLGRPVRLVRAGKRPAGGPTAAAPAGELAPGRLARHYSPRTPVRLHARLSAALVRRGGADEAWVYLARPAGPEAGRPNVLWLDPRGDLRGAARTLFSILRALDAGGYRLIHAELAAGTGLAEALNDRLRRAASRG